MEMPKNYTAVKTSGDFTPVEVGGHHLIIKQVNETMSKTNKKMLVVLFDMATNDKQANYMSEEFKNDIRPEKKWPHAGTQYILVEDANGECTKNFKSFMTSFEKSNGCSAIWGEKFIGQFKNKKIGGVFGLVENEYNGKTTMRSELRWFCDDAKADTVTAPQPKLLGNTTNNTQSAPATGSASNINDFMPVEDAGDEIPWG